MDFYLGFPEDCLQAKPAIVKDLDSESRAAEAGVSEGNIISPQYSFSLLPEDGDRNLICRSSAVAWVDKGADLVTEES